MLFQGGYGPSKTEEVFNQISSRFKIFESTNGNGLAQFVCDWLS
jgi:hypothetical protein